MVFFGVAMWLWPDRSIVISFSPALHFEIGNLGDFLRSLTAVPKNRTDPWPEMGISCRTELLPIFEGFWVARPNQIPGWPHAEIADFEQQRCEKVSFTRLDKPFTGSVIDASDDFQVDKTDLWGRRSLLMNYCTLLLPGEIKFLLLDIYLLACRICCTSS